METPAPGWARQPSYGWNGLIARTSDLFARLKREDVLRASKGVMAITREQVAGQKRGTIAHGDRSVAQFLVICPAAQLHDLPAKRETAYNPPIER